MKTPIRTLLAHKGRRVQNTTPDTTVTEAVSTMNELRIGALLVLDAQQLVGIFTERDVMMRVVAQRRDPDSTKVRDVMTKEVLVVQPADTVEKAMRIMMDKGCRHLPVAENGDIVGLISIRDCSNWAVRETKQELDNLVGYMYRSYPN